MKTYQELPPRSKHFDTLYHGTPLENAINICKHGIKRGTYQRMGNVSLEDPLGVDRVSDCVGSVSLSKDLKSSIFFAAAWRDASTIKNSPGQAIFEIDASKLDKNKMFFRNMFGKPWAEVKYIGDIPPSAIKRIFVRKFDWKDGLNVEEKYVTCNQLKGLI